MDNNITPEFEYLVKTESNDFSSILDVMMHSKKEVGRQFLNLLNQILDYYLYSSKSNEGINLQIIHIPTCEPWARELFLRFLIHKIALFHNKTTLERFKQESTKTITCNDNKETKRLQERNKYFRSVLKSFKNNQSIKSNDSTNLIIVKENDLRSTKDDKNPWLFEYAVDIRKISDRRYNLCIDSDVDTNSLKSVYQEDEILSLENIFIFQTRNKVTRTYSRNQLDRLNRFNANIKNCFIFSFSEEPFILDRIKTKVKSRLISIYNQTAVTKYYDFGGFITFDKHESDYIFNRESNTKTLIIDPDEREYFSDEMEVFIETITPNLRFRNQLSLCFNQKLQKEISAKISEFTHDFKSEMCSGYFSILSQTWSNTITPTIKEFINNGSTVAIIVDKDTTVSARNQIIELFQKQNTQFSFYSIDSLKNKKVKDSITADKIIILQYRSPNGRFSYYPNIFDQLTLNKKQEALIIINKLTHFSYYDWDIYRYRKSLNELLYSNFRENILAWKYLKLSQPQSENIKNYLDEDDEVNNHNYQVEKCKVHFKGAIRTKELPLYENVIFSHNGKKSIDEIRTILELPDVEIQLLDEVTDIIKMFISQRIEENNNAELTVRRDIKYNLSHDEIYSTTELWKILLKRKVDAQSPLIVYNEIFKNTPPTKRISLNAFIQWYNLDRDLILPRSNKDKKAILEYLGFEPTHAYRKIINKKKLSSINGSRKMNSLIENFLKDYLFSENNEEIFYQCKSIYADLLELIDSNTLNDFVALKQMILQEIDLKPVDSFEYD
ncbi:MAG: hypothetical protein QMB99_09230 [Paludibacteraceae bacterium]